MLALLTFLLCVLTYNIALSDFSVTLDHHLSLVIYDKLQKIKTHYNRAIRLFNVGKIHDAEQQLSLVLKPVLSNQKGKVIIPLKDIGKIKEVLLMSMYHIGLIYLIDTGRINNYAMAAAIFNYCARFSKKYNCLLSLDVFLEQANNIEKEILNHYNIYPDDQNLLLYRNKIRYYKKALNNFRVFIANELCIIDKTFRNWEDWSSKVELIHKNIFHFFINNAFPNDSEILQDMIVDCQKQIGSVPDGCEYSIIALGSFALGTMTPWSDLEFAILLNKDKEEYKQYFRKLTELLNIKIVNIGESNLRWMGIKSLNNFASGKEEDDWFYDHISLFGFALDGKHWHACETPLGRIGYKKKVIGDNGSISFEDRDDFELIHTPFAMSMFQSNDRNNKFPIEDPYLVQSLRSVAWVVGSQVIVDEYRKCLQQVVAKEVVQQRIATILESDIQKYRIKHNDVNDLKRFIDVKMDIYRLVDRLTSALGQYYFIMPLAGEPSITSWCIIKLLKNNRIISRQEAYKLKHALSISTRLRYATYYNNFGKDKGKLAMESVNIHKINILKHYYLIMLEIQDVLRIKLYNEK